MDQDLSSFSLPPVKSHRGILIFILIFGVVFPILALVVELLYHFCAEAFFNPIPSVLHGILIALVAGLNLWGLLILRKQGDIRRRFYLIILWANGFAIGVSIYFALLFLPIMLISLLFIPFFGLGLLGLAPLFSLLGGWFLRRRLKSLKDPKQPEPRLKPWWGIVVGVLILIGLDTPVTMTRIGLSLAVSQSEHSHQVGLSLLRTLGNREQMLRACYERPGYSVDLIGSLCNMVNSVSPEEARRIYYQVTGATFNSVPPPRLTGRGALNSDEWFWDEDQGGDKVSVVIKGLSLAGSRLDTSIDPEAAVTYSEWTMTFVNQSGMQHEARTQILLPPGGVVSRLTLWVNGEEREAAFARRSQVKSAYQTVVHAQRDPVLVTSTGPDRVLLQCFPVPPHGGTMKVRLGITAPLILETALTKGSLFLPIFSERNFLVPEELKHAVWLESTQKLSTSVKGLNRSHGVAGVFGLRGNIDESVLSRRIRIQAERNPAITGAFTADDADQGFILQRINRVDQPPLQRLIVALDGSAALENIRRSLTEILAILPQTASLDLIVAGDGIRARSFPSGSKRWVDVKTWLKQSRFNGGKDNVPALLKAIEVSEEEPNSLILWIHGPQPVLLSALDPLEQWFDRSSTAVPIYEYQVTPGPNLILEQLGAQMEPIYWSGDCQKDLRQFLEVCAGKRKEINLVREMTGSVSIPEPIVRTSKHLARLWANDQVAELIRKGQPQDLKQALKIAGAYQIVTPISGAVVLESQAQYQEAGLNPVDPNAVPTVPEAELPLLLVVVSLLLGGFLWIHYRMRRVHEAKV